MIYMARVKAVVTTTRGRFVDLELENVPKGPLMRFRVPSEAWTCEQRVTVNIELHEVKKLESVETGPCRHCGYVQGTHRDGCPGDPPRDAAWAESREREE